MINLKMDPYILLSIINTLLRNRSKLLEDLCEEIAIDSTQLCQIFSTIGYEYNEEVNQFRPLSHELK